MRVLFAIATVVFAGLAAGREGADGAEAPDFHSLDFPDAESCKTCHPRQYLEWSGSAHAYALADPLYRACQRSALADAGEEVGGSCLGCHSPVGLRSGELRPRFELDSLSRQVQDAVSCVACHRAEPPADPGAARNANFTLTPGDVFYGRLHKPVDNTAHGSAHSAYVASSELCGACHDVLEKGRKIEKTFTEWDGSAFHERPVECNDCHMLRYSGKAATEGPFREELRRHNFPGVSLPPKDFPNRGYQSEEVGLFLRSAARMSVIVPEAASAGGSMVVVVRVKNSGTAHNLPAASFRQLWIEVTVTDSEGKVVFRSGHLDEDGNLLDLDADSGEDRDPQLVVFADHHLDALRREVPHWRATQLEEKSLEPLEERVSRYRLQVPESLEGSSVRVLVRLLFRSFSPYKMRKLGVAHLAEDIPVWELHRFSSLPLPVVRAAPRRTSYRVPEDFPGPQEALDALEDGDEVVVLPGEYVLRAPLDFRGKAIRLRSREGRWKTLLRLSEEARESERASVVVFENDEGPGARLEGFSITGGRGVLEDGERRGGGVYIRASSPELLLNRVVMNGAPDGIGGGVWCEGGDPRLEGNVVESCWARRGGGVALREVRKPGLVLRGNIIQGNLAAEGGGLHLENVSVDIEHGVFAGNVSARAGAAVYGGDGVVVRVRHSTVVRNRGRAGQGPMHVVGDGTLSASHSIFWRNRPPQPEAGLEFSIVGAKEVERRGNFAAPPLFLDARGAWIRSEEDPQRGRGVLTADDWPSVTRWAGGDYRLLPGSPAIDAGDPTATADPDDTTPDLGAFFFEQPLHGFIRADVNQDGEVAWPDLYALALHIITGEPVECLDAADVDDGGSVNVADLALLGSFLVCGKPQPEAPFAACGLDPTFGEGLSCTEESRACKGEWGE